MPEFEIYFSGLMCFICNNGFYQTVALVDDPSEHKASVWLGPTATKLPAPIPLNGESISLDIKGVGVPCNDKLLHLKPLLDGSPVLRDPLPTAGTLLLPDGSLDISMKMDDATITRADGSHFTRAVSQIVIVKIPNEGRPIKVTVGQRSDFVSASSFMVVGNLSPKHDPDTHNHFEKYVALVKNTGGGKPRVTDGTLDKVLHAGAHRSEAEDFIEKQIPHIVTAGAPDCTITQWP